MVDSPSGPEDAALCGRLLVVDDEPFVLSYLTRTLTARGHEVVTATDGDTALQRLQTGSFELVLSDLTMPGVDGVGFLRAARERDSDLPIVLITGNPDLTSAMRAVEFGAFRYLTKPLRDAELHATVQDGLRSCRDSRRKRHALELLERDPAIQSAKAKANAALDDVLTTMWMAYQPIVRAKDRVVFAHEALLRSKSTVLTHPGMVLDTAEDVGRTLAVGQRVRDLVSRDLSVHPEQTFFINLHAADLLDDSLYDLAHPLTQVAKRVVLEITERAALGGVDDVQARTRRLRALGFGLAVDDLGAGYAGLNSFAQIAPDFVKLDISLVRDIHQDKLKQKLVQSLTTLCKDMGITVVAEGVETNEEEATLLELGCDLLQGFLLGRPSPTLLAQR